MTDGAHDTVDMIINLGPQHPSTHGVFRMVLQIEGEKIAGCIPHIGYLHRGFEKLAENEPYHTVLIHVDRTDYVSGFNNEHAYIRALEQLCGVEPAERAQYIRVILDEMNRLVSHYLFYGAFGGDAGALTPFLYGFRERERLQQLFEMVSGARLMHFYHRVGGVRADLPEGFERELRRALDQTKIGLEECDTLLSENEVFLARTKGVGYLPPDDLINWGVSGPVLRAAGVPHDIRKDEPYSVYPRLRFDVPVFPNGDCFDRYQVRIAEMWQSISIIEQCLDQMEPGPVLGKVPRFIRPEPGEAYVRAENPRGDYGVYLISRGGNNPWRCKLRSPCYVNLEALPDMLRGAYVADAIMILGSLDIVLGEVDR